MYNKPASVDIWLSESSSQHVMNSIYHWGVKISPFLLLSSGIGVPNSSDPTGWVNGSGLIHGLNEWHAASPVGWPRPMDQAPTPLDSACFSQSRTVSHAAPVQGQFGICAVCGASPEVLDQPQKLPHVVYVPDWLGQTPCVVCVHDWPGQHGSQAG